MNLSLRIKTCHITRRCGRCGRCGGRCGGSMEENKTQFILLALYHMFLALHSIPNVKNINHITIGVVVRMSILDTKVAGSNLSINMFSP